MPFDLIEEPGTPKPSLVHIWDLVMVAHSNDLHRFDFSDLAERKFVDGRFRVLPDSDSNAFLNVLCGYIEPENIEEIRKFFRDAAQDLKTPVNSSAFHLALFNQVKTLYLHNLVSDVAEDLKARVKRDFKSIGDLDVLELSEADVDVSEDDNTEHRRIVFERLNKQVSRLVEEEFNGQSSFKLEPDFYAFKVFEEKMMKYRNLAESIGPG